MGKPEPARLIPLEDLDREWFADPEMRAAFDRENPFAEVARAVVALRVRYGFSQSEFAAKVGCPQSYVARLESGKANVRMATLVGFAQALGLRLRIQYDDAAALEPAAAARSGEA